MISWVIALIPKPNFNFPVPNIVNTWHALPNSVQMRLGTLCGIFYFSVYCMLDVTPVVNMLIPFHVGAKNIHAYRIKRS